jgi:hypothetical protein
VQRGAVQHLGLPALPWSRQAAGRRRTWADALQRTPFASGLGRVELLLRYADYLLGHGRSREATATIAELRPLIGDSELLKRRLEELEGRLTAEARR